MAISLGLGLLILRLVAGLTLAAHGAQKLFGWFGGYGLTGTGGFLEQLGFIPGRRNALFAGLAEFAAGLLLAVGLATPLAATLITGAGPVSVDAALHLHDAGLFWGLAALLAGVAGGLVQLAGRRAPAAQKAS